MDSLVEKQQLEDAQRLIDWLKANGGHWNPSLTLRIDPATGLSAFTSAPISSNEALVSCPIELVVTPALATSSICSLLAIDEQRLQSWNERMRICAYLSLHTEWEDRLTRSPSSTSSSWPDQLKHREYVAALPKPSALSTPLFFSAAELELLAGTNLRGAIEERSPLWQAEARTVREVLGEDGLTWERYLASATYISSRAFPSKLLELPSSGANESSAVRTPEGEESHPVLLPGVDLFNHARGQPITWLTSPSPPFQSSSSSPSSSSGSTKAYISLVPPSPLDAGVQAFNNYGPKPNEELLLAYGFVLPDNPDDTLGLKLGRGVLRDPKVAERVERAGLRGDLEKRWEVRRDGKIPDGLVRVVRALLGGEAQAHGEDLEEEEEEEDMHEEHEREQRDMQLEMDVLGMLGQMMEDKLGKLQGSGGEGDEEAAEQGSKVRDEVRRMCEIYRQGQVEILEAAMDKLEERIERVEGLLDQGVGGCPCCG